MATIRAYLKLEGITVHDGHQGRRFIDLEIDGSRATQTVSHDGGHWYMSLNGKNPRVPAELCGRVTRITSSESHVTTIDMVKVIEPGRYRSRSGKCTAEVQDDLRGNNHTYRTIEIKARNLHAWRQFRNRLIAGELTPTRSYARS